MTTKRFDVVRNEFDELEYITDSVDGEYRDFADFMEFANEMAKENDELKQQISYYEKLITDKEVEWLRDNTVWEQMPSSKRTFTKTSK